MNNLQSLLALIVGIISFLSSTPLAVTLIGIYLVITGLIGLLGSGTSASSLASKTAPKIEKE